jgi:bifunctional DNA-binding transcriptional regulator/antitoxin component of YhaV-PrlF toxin-antitoxin module
MVAVSKVLARGQVTVPREIRRATGLKPGALITFRATAPDTVELKVLPHLTLAEMLDRYQITGPIDEVADREAWQAEAAKDVLGEPDD